MTPQNLFLIYIYMNKSPMFTMYISFDRGYIHVHILHIIIIGVHNFDIWELKFQVMNTYYWRLRILLYVIVVS